MDTNNRQEESKPGGILKSEFGRMSKKPLSISISPGPSENIRYPLLGYDLNENRDFTSISPDPSVDRLSVTWADTEDNSLSKCNFFSPGTPPSKMEVRFPEEILVGEQDEEEDYSASVSAILQRRASTRKSRKRRSSSPFSSDQAASFRRRSSVFTTSSDTAASIDSQHEVTQEQIFENIRLHKDVLKSVKQQPWRMSRKLKLVHQAKTYIKRHQGALQERLAQSRCTRDILARFHIFVASKVTRLRRQLANFSNWVILWESRIKEIESHFGSVVASYFTFLRWLFWVNLVIGAALFTFVVLPQVYLPHNVEGMKRNMFSHLDEKAGHFLTLWKFEGYLQDTPLFYGFYSHRNPQTEGGYHLPLAYFIAGLAVYVYSFFATLKKMAKNSRMSKLSEKEDECVFSWKLFTGWDYMIGNTETAQNKMASLILGFKEALLEEAERKKDSRNWKIIFKRILVNICVIILLAASAYIVVKVVQQSNELEKSPNFFKQNAITIVMSLLSFTFPPIFEILGLLEGYHPRKQLRVQLARIMLFNLLNLYSLIFALFEKIDDMTVKSQTLKPNTTSMDLSTSTTAPTTPFTPTILDLEPENMTLSTELLDPNSKTVCYNVTVECATLMTSAITMAATLITSPTQSYGSFNSSESTTEFDLNNYDNDENYQFDDSGIFNVNATYDYFNSTSFDPYYSTMFDANSTNVYPYSSTFDFNSTPADFYSTIENIEIATETEKQLCVQTVCSSLTAVPWVDPNYKYNDVNYSLNSLDLKTRKELSRLCWETMFGQELVKLTVMDLLLTVLGTIMIDFIRAVFIRMMNSCWCWDLEKTFPQYGNFKIAENILHLVSNQGMVWMGMFFSPGLVILNVIKLVVLMYLRSWTVMTCNIPHEVVFRASRSNNFYFTLLLTMLFLCVLPVGYAIVWLQPSWHCGPFSYYERIYHLFTQTLLKIIPKNFHTTINYIASPGIIIPLLVLLILIIYYLLSLTSALREANNDLKIQLRRERTEERRKVFQMANKHRRNGSNDSANTPYSKWKKILPVIHKSDTESEIAADNNEQNKADKKDLMVKIIKLALRKSSAASEDGSALAAPLADEESDSEFHESFPENVLNAKDIKFKKENVHKAKLDSENSANKDAKLTHENEQKTSKSTKGVKKIKLANQENLQSENKECGQDDCGETNIPLITISKAESDENILDKPKKDKVITFDEPDLKNAN